MNSASTTLPTLHSSDRGFPPQPITSAAETEYSQVSLSCCEVEEAQHRKKTKLVSRHSKGKGSDEMIADQEGLDQDRMIVLSLKPRFTEAILAGTKTVELRRTTPKIEVPTRALLYATTPVQALLGMCIIISVASSNLTALWREYGSRSELTFHEFKRYFEGLEVGTALTLAHERPFSRMVPLQDLRARPSGFRPPQSFAFVDTRTGERLLQMAA